MHIIYNKYFKIVVSQLFLFIFALSTFEMHAEAKGPLTGTVRLKKVQHRQLKEDIGTQKKLSELEDSIKKDRFTQTVAHLSLESIRELIEKIYGDQVTPFFNIIASAIVQEQKLKDTHFVCYHGTDSEWMVAQDLYTQLYKYLYPEEKISEEFKFTRFAEESIGHETAQDFLVSELQEKGLINDQGAMGAVLISTNLALFGNVSSSGECTWEYFLESKSHYKPTVELYKKMMDHLELTDKYIEEIFALNDVVKTKGQMLMQIFIPQEKIDEIAYLAWTRGIPAHQKTIKWILGNVPNKAWESVKPVMEQLTEQFKTEQEKNSMFKEIMDEAKKGGFSPHAYLKMYRNKPWEVEGINYTQARLIVTPDMLLNPEWGIKIHRYTTLSRETLKEYNDKLNAIIDKIIKEKGSQVKEEAPRGDV